VNELEHPAGSKLQQPAATLATITEGIPILRRSGPEKVLVIAGLRTAGLLAVACCAVACCPRQASAMPRPMHAGFVAPARPQSEQTPRAALTIVASGRIRSVRAGEAVYDLGSVDAFDQEIAEQDFTLRNDSSASITVVRLQSSCGCTSAFIRSAGGAIALAPGRQLVAHVAVNLAALHPGPIRKLVEVLVQGDLMPAAVLRVEGTLESAVAFLPQVVDFGRVHSGAAPRITLTVAVNPRVGIAPPPLESTDPGIRIRAIQPAAHDSTTGSPDAGRSNGQAHTRVAQVYEVSLAPDTPLGCVNAMLEFADSPGESSLAARAFSGMVVPVRAEVIGDVSARPQAVVFGAVQQAGGASMQVTLDASAAAAADRLTIRSGSPHLKFSLGPWRSQAPPGRQATLTVQLAANVPTGPFHSELRIALPNGQRLLLPVSAYVTK
jgi:hypothetical protein